MDEKQYKELVEKLGKEAADQIKAHAERIEKELNDKFKEMQKGAITQEQFDSLKKELVETELKEINEKLAKAEDVAKEQGIIINMLKENGSAKQNKSLEEFFGDLLEWKVTDEKEGKGVLNKLREMRAKGHGFIEVTATQLKAAGVTSIGNSIQDMTQDPGNSPYLPGIGGADLQLFEIAQNPNFIINYVDLGRTNQRRLAWINETVIEGTPGTDIAEGGDKPLTQHKFKVEFSDAKKAATYIELTDEFEEDVPGLATAVRRMLQDDVIRQWDTTVQTAVIAAAKGYEITQLDGEIADANLWSAVRAMEGQVQYYNYMPNTVAMNGLTSVKVDEQKNTNGTYLLPPFMNRIQAKKVEANKIAYDYALVGDLKQYKVDIYKEFYFKIGWINDNLIQNKFCIVGEMRYHNYISDNRKKAICYDKLSDVKDAIQAGS